MREIEYRGWDSHNKRWVYGLLLMDAKGHYRIQYDPMRFSVIVDPDSIGEYTGIKSENDKKIYEGDILTDKFESIGVVEWRDGAFVVNFGDVDVFQIVDCFDDSYQMWAIGNIHDNPELLE